MKVYHASPNSDIKKLFNNSYVTFFLLISYNMGLYYKETGKTWKDDDLKKPYGFENKIIFKPNRKPDGKPILYVCDIDPENIIMHKNFPFEFIIKKGVKCSKIGEKNLNLLLKKSIKYLKLTDEINF